MAKIRYKRVEGSKKYKYVTKIMDAHGNYMFQANCKGRTKVLKTEREAAIMVDKILITAGKEPVNILVRK